MGKIGGLIFLLVVFVFVFISLLVAGPSGKETSEITESVEGTESEENIEESTSTSNSEVSIETTDNGAELALIGIEEKFLNEKNVDYIIENTYFSASFNKTFEEAYGFDVAQLINITKLSLNKVAYDCSKMAVEITKNEKIDENNVRLEYLRKCVETTDEEIQEPESSEIIDCGTDLNCIISNSKTCTSSKFNYKTNLTFDIWMEGYLQEIDYNYEVKPGAENCSLSVKLNYYKASLLDASATPDSEPVVRLQREMLNGKEGKCVGKADSISLYFEELQPEYQRLSSPIRLFEIRPSSGSQELDCSGPYFEAFYNLSGNFQPTLPEADYAYMIKIEDKWFINIEKEYLEEGLLNEGKIENTGSITAQSCTVGPGINCDDFKVNTTHVQLILTNDVGEDLTKVWVTMPTCTASDLNADGDDNWPDGTILGSTSIFLSKCSNGAAGATFKEDIIVSYLDVAGIQHNQTGLITAKVESEESTETLNITDNRNTLLLGIEKDINSHTYDIFNIEDGRVRIKQDGKTSDWIYEDQTYLWNLTNTKIVVLDILYQPYIGGKQEVIFVFNESLGNTTG